MKAYLTEVDLISPSNNRKPLHFEGKSAGSTIHENAKTKLNSSIKFKELKKTQTINNFFNDHYYKNKKVKPGFSIYKYIL